MIKKLRRYHLTILTVFAFLWIPITVFIDLNHVLIKGYGALFSEVLLVAIFIDWLLMVRKERHFVLIAFFLLSMAIHLYLILRIPRFLYEYKAQMYLILAQAPLLLILGFNAVILPFREKLIEIHARTPGSFNRMAVFSAILIVSLIFLVSPITTHISDPQSMPFAFGKLLLWHGIYTLIAIVIAIAVYRLSPSHLKPPLAAGYLALALSAWVYAYLLPGDYGVLDVTILTEPGRLAEFKTAMSTKEIILVLVEVFSLAAAMALMFFLCLRFTRRVLPLVIIVNLMTFGQALFNVVTTENLWRPVGNDNSQAFLPDDAANAFRFSKEKNIAIFMFDMFGADLIPEVLEEYPEIKDKLEGFIWYPSALSTGFSTYGSLPSILAGPEFSPERVNERDIISMDNMMRDAHAYYAEFCKKNGFDFTFIHPVDFPLEEYKDEWDLTVVNPISYMEYWLNSTDEAESLQLRISAAAYTRFFSAIGLFKSSPYFLRPYIYMDGLWLMLHRGNLDIQHAIIHLAVLDLLDTLSHVDDGPPTLKFINNEFTHIPWSIGLDLKLEQHIDSSYVTNPDYGVRTVRNDAVYRTAVRALYEIAAFIDWLDTHKIKDRTKIVLVSDHGYFGIHRQWKDNPVMVNDKGRAVEGSSRFNSLLMVKEFDDRAPFRIDSRLMSIADTPAIALSLPDDPRVGDAHDRKIVTSIVPYLAGDSGFDSYTIRHQWIIEGDPSRPEHWSYVVHE